jgi:glycerate 2-kinase
MSLRVLIVPDKFKGTLTARAAAEAIAGGWMQARPMDDLEMLPMSDGGDGFGAIMADLLGAEERTVGTVDAAHRPLTATWWYEPASRRAIVESAGIIGLALLPPGRFHPFELDTTGLGAAIRAAWHAGATEILMGIGGSATNDAGFGFARALGWEFCDASERPVEKWIQLDRLHHWFAARDLPECAFTVAVDVDNPLLGPNGCSRVYGPQKGLRAEQAPLAENALRRLAELAAAERGADIASEPGAGAAGGLGFGLRAFLGATLESGFGIFARQAGLEERIAAADLVITGEGSIDRQTYMGKGTGQVATLCQRHGKRCIGLAGMTEGLQIGAGVNRLFHLVAGMAPALTSPAEAKSKPSVWLARLAEKVGRQYLG